MAQLLYPAAHGDQKVKKSLRVARFLGQQALGLTARLSEVINDTLKSNLPMQARRRGIMAMEEMITLMKMHVGIVRPQVRVLPCLLRRRQRTLISRRW